MYKKKSWREKLAGPKDLPKVIEIGKNLAKAWGKGTVVVPAPKEVDEIMRKVPKGRLITINQIRKRLAKRHRATIGCPITTGLFARIAAEAAEEDMKSGSKQATPYWRTLKERGVINEKYPGGIKVQRMRLEKEGFTVTQKGKKYVVENYKARLMN